MEESTRIEIMKLAAQMVADSADLRKSHSIDFDMRVKDKYHDLFDKNIEHLKDVFKSL